MVTLNLVTECDGAIAHLEDTRDDAAFLRPDADIDAEIEALKELRLRAVKEKADRDEAAALMFRQLCIR